MCRHMYDWNIVNCDVKQQIHLTSPIFKSHQYIQNNFYITVMEVSWGNPGRLHNWLEIAWDAKQAYDVKGTRQQWSPVGYMME